MSPNPRIEPLIDGSIKPEGIDLDFHFVPNLFYDNLRFDRFDVFEMSISEMLIARERRASFGNGKWDWLALPVSESRGHGWGGMYVTNDSGIDSLADLKGKRIGVSDYEMTSALWLRVVLKELHGTEASDVVWYNLRVRGESHALELGLDVDPPAGVTIHFLEQSGDAREMLLRGELDAVAMATSQSLDHARLRKLLPDNGREVIGEFYRKTQWHQLNHQMVVQGRLLRESPWVALALYEAFQRSKAMAYQSAGPRALIDPPTGLGAEVFGADPYPFGLRAMRQSLARLIQGSREQGLIRQPAEVEEMYAPNTLDT